MKNQNQFVQAMKCCLTNGKFALLLLSSILIFTSCGNKLTRDKAEQLIKDFYKFPNIEINGLDDNFSKNLLQPQNRANLENYITKGYVKIHDLTWMMMPSYVDVNPTGIGKEFLIGKYSQYEKSKVITNCRIFNEITGIVIDNNSKTAKVEYTIKRIGITPFGELFNFKDNDIKSYSCNFMLYDDGWRIIDDNTKVVAATTKFYFNEKGEFTNFENNYALNGTITAEEYPTEETPSTSTNNSNEIIDASGLPVTKEDLNK